MKALSLWQPWATLIAIGAKRIETRHWPTPRSIKFPTRIAIHAAKKKDADSLMLCLEDEAFNRALIAAGIRTIGDLPFGAIVATADLVACLQIPAVYRKLDAAGETIELPPGEPEQCFGDYHPGRYAWILRNVRPLHIPLPFKGAQGLFEVPDSLFGN